MFRDGEIGWFAFWEYYKRIPVIRAQHRLNAMQANQYGHLYNSSDKKDNREATKLMKLTTKEASNVLHIRGKPSADPYEALTTIGQRGE